MIFITCTVEDNCIPINSEAKLMKHIPGGENPGSSRFGARYLSRAGWDDLRTLAATALTFALLGGGGGVWTPLPLRFFADSKKTAARSAAGFSPILSPIFLATFVKVSILGHAKSGHQVRSSDHTLQKLYNRAPATVFEGKLWNFRNMIRSSVPTKCLSWIFDIGDLRSGHFRDLPIVSQWAKIKLPVLCFILSLYEWNRIR